TFATPNDTPELNALKALFGAPISMGRGENPVELLPAAACFLPIFIYFERRIFMGKKQASTPVIPLLKTVEQMSKISGIGENKLRELMDKGEIEYVQNGNRRLIAESAIWDWYNRNKVPAKASGGE
ncbi:MAG: helix-turn-helix domain-containing protein, partial [Oscillospiraceae bacterium]